MSVFRINLCGPRSEEHISDIVSFTGKDASGSFSIRANASRRMTALAFGLAHFRNLRGQTEYLALPGGILYFASNELHIATVSYVRDLSYETVSSALEDTLKQEQENIKEIRRSLHQLDEEILKRMFQIKMGGEK